MIRCLPRSSFIVLLEVGYAVSLSLAIIAPKSIAVDFAIWIRLSHDLILLLIVVNLLCAMYDVVNSKLRTSEC